MFTPTMALRQRIEARVARTRGKADIARIVFETLRAAGIDWREASLDTVKDLAIVAALASRRRPTSPWSSMWSESQRSRCGAHR